ncbi:SEL1-like repeat protein [Legionella longbeachae]|uniref:SEL1-like repeat protein n=1 Tax=Legionella longbeachae TaxID=450 RepID=UPI0014046B4E|nr:tetratricopeptide repeat protein [Legionella longbeachae]QIN36836.1 hypothetical protein GCS73_14920 [Legionella longbeachae]
MKKTIFSKSSIVTIILFSLVLGSYYHKKETLQQSDSPLPKSEKIPDQKQITGEKKENPCQESENIINALVRKLYKTLGSNEEEVKKNRTLFLHQDESLKKILIENNECGASSASRLANIYSQFGLKDQANKYHKIVIGLAEKGNATAIERLCSYDNKISSMLGYDSVTTKEQKLHFCKLVIKNEKSDSKFFAVAFLGQLYFDENKEDELFDLCNKAGDSKDHCYMLYLFPLSDKLYKEKKYERAIKFYEKIEPLDTKGIYFVAWQLAEIYAQGNGTAIDYSAAISWYEKALEKKYNDKLYAMIMNDMCVAYDNQKDFVNAFNCYKQAAIMGNATAQRNLAIDYLNGHGTIQDYHESYAWISVAIAQGLSKNQDGAEKIRDWLTYNLIAQDKKGNELMHAKELAQKYYKQYVLHESPVANK